MKIESKLGKGFDERYAGACASLLPPHYKSVHVHSLSVEEQWECGYGGVQQAQAIQAEEEHEEAAIRAVTSVKGSECPAASGRDAHLRKKTRRGGYGARWGQRSDPQSAPGRVPRCPPHECPGEHLRSAQEDLSHAATESHDGDGSAPEPPKESETDKASCSSTP